MTTTTTPQPLAELEALRRENEALKQQLQTAQHYATVGAFAISDDLQYLMLDGLEIEGNWIAWGELSHALSEMDALKRVVTSEPII